MGDSHRFDLIMRTVIVSLVVAVLALAGYFGWTLYRDRVIAERSSPAGRIIAVLRGQVEEDPNDAARRVRLGEALAAAGREKEAIEQFNAALKIDPEHTGALIDLGQLAMRAKRTAEAEGYFTKVLDLTEGSEFENASDRREVALYQLGVMAVSDRRYEEAIGYFKSALRIRKDASDTYYFLALALDGIGESEEAVKQLEIALAFDPNFGQAHYYLGQLHTRAGDDIKASYHFGRAAKADPEAPEPREALARFGTAAALLTEAREVRSGDPEKALRSATIAFNVDPDNLDAVRLKAELQEEAGDRKGALESYRAAVVLAPEDAALKAAVERLEKALKKKSR